MILANTGSQFFTENTEIPYCKKTQHEFSMPRKVVKDECLLVSLDE